MKRLFFLSLLASTTATYAQGSWVADLRGQAGPAAMVELQAPKGETRLAIITFEYARKCDPGLSHFVMRGRSLGKIEKQQRLPASSIGSILNGKRYTGPAVASIYSNAVDIAFAMPDDMAMTIAFEKVNSFSYVSPKGEEVRLPIGGLRAAVDKAIEACVSKIQP